MSGSHAQTSVGASSRRDFLKLSGNVAAASILAGVGPRLYAGESNTIKLALRAAAGAGPARWPMRLPPKAGR